MTMKIIGLFIFWFLILTGTSAQKKKIYIAPDDHTDYMWSADEAGYRNAFLETLDYYIWLNDSTANEPYSYQSKWNCDGSYWAYEYQKKNTYQFYSFGHRVFCIFPLFGRDGFFPAGTRNSGIPL